MSVSLRRELCLRLGQQEGEGSYLVAGFSLLSQGTRLSGLTLGTTLQTVCP